MTTDCTPELCDNESSETGGGNGGDTDSAAENNAGANGGNGDANNQNGMGKTPSSTAPRAVATLSLALVGAAVVLL